MTRADLALWYEAKEADARVVAKIGTVDPADVLIMSSIVMNLSRGRKRLDSYFSVNGEVFGTVVHVGLEAFERQEEKTYRLDRVEKKVAGADVETIEMNEVVWNGTNYEATGDGL